MFSKFKQLNRCAWTAIILVLLSFCMFSCMFMPDFRSVSNPKPGAIARNPIDGAEMVYIPEGEFMMGTDKDEIDQIWQKFGWEEIWKQGAKDESPKHRVYVDGFWMYKYEVTVAQYRKFCNGTGCQMPSEPSWGWQDNHPIVDVTYDDAVAYCKWAGVQLPTEAEWEYAARGGNTGLNGKPRYIFVWGDEFPKGKGGYGNFADESLKKVSPAWTIFEGYDDGYVYTAPVGSFKPNEFGLYDMAGNVWEWCEDWYDENYYQNSPTRNPKGPADGTMRVLRGGSWCNCPNYARAATRDRYDPGFRLNINGFRGSSPRPR
jgi:formylglycine-generating enzyme required for sulfatase activity